jgi:mono/diheme cytochrome c family protein
MQIKGIRPCAIKMIQLEKGYLEAPRECEMRALLLGLSTLLIAAVAALNFPEQEACGQASKSGAKTKQPVQTVSFAEDVFPIFKGRCVECHQPGGKGYETSGLDLRTHEGLMKGTKFGPMVVAGNPDVSNLIWLLDWRASPQLRMPHGAKQLSTCDRNAIRTWIREGAHNN